jgi:hypothetical protein
MITFLIQAQQMSFKHNIIQKIEKEDFSEIF